MKAKDKRARALVEKLEASGVVFVPQADHQSFQLRGPPTVMKNIDAELTELADEISSFLYTRGEHVSQLLVQPSTETRQ